MKNLADALPGELRARMQAVADRCRAEPEYAARIEREHFEQQAQARARHEAAELARAPEHLEFCGVPPHAAKLLVDPAKTKALDLVARWLAGEKTFLALLGAPGTGKTTAAASTLLQREPDFTADTGATWRWRSRRGSFASAAEQAMQDAFGERARLEVERMKRVPLLVVDELGDEFKSAPWLARLSLVVDHRYSAGHRTVLVGNVDFEGFTARYGRRVAERVQEKGAVVELSEADRVRKAVW